MLDPNGTAATFYDVLTLTAATKLDFFIVDGYLPDNAGGVALNIAQLGGGVPEPATWAMMVIGLGLAGASLRRRSRSSVQMAVAAV